MKKLKLEVEAENQEELKYALQEAVKQMENGYTSGDLRNEDNEDIENGFWEITEA